MSLRNDPNNLLPLNSFDVPTLLNSEEAQKGILLLSLAQSDWYARVGIATPEKAASSDKESGS